MLELNKLYLGDCLEVMKDIDDKSVDLILCDLPYGITQNKWDSIIPLEPLWEQYKRVIKDNGAIVLTASGIFTAKLMLSNEKMYKYDLIWEKTNPSGFLNVKKQPLRAHESILLFYEKQCTYNPQKTSGHKPVNSFFKKAEVQNKGTNYGKVNKDLSGGGSTDRFPRSVLLFPSDKQKTKLTGFTHPTQKPVALFEYLIKTYTNEGDLVLDNCIGSGTTAIACINTNRNYIGIEQDETYYNLANQRIENHVRTQ